MPRTKCRSEAAAAAAAVQARETALALAVEIVANEFKSKKEAQAAVAKAYLNSEVEEANRGRMCPGRRTRKGLWDALADEDATTGDLGCKDWSVCERLHLRHGEAHSRASCKGAMCGQTNTPSDVRCAIREHTQHFGLSCVGVSGNELSCNKVEAAKTTTMIECDDISCNEITVPSESIVCDNVSGIEVEPETQPM